MDHVHIGDVVAVTARPLAGQHARVIGRETGVTTGTPFYVVASPLNGLRYAFRRDEITPAPAARPTSMWVVA